MAERRGNLVTLLIALAVCGILVRTLIAELSTRPGAPHPMRAVTIGLLMVWLLLESPVAMRVSTDDKRGEDRGTLLLNAVSRGLAVVAALALPSIWTRWNAFQTAGLVLFAAGFCFRLAAIRQLGRFYSHKVRRAEGHEIIDQGPYRVVRHPAYLGVIAAHLGFALVFLNAWSALAVAILVIPAFVWRIHVEEPLLMQIPGYAHYARGHARLLPGLW
jgi:protein-S-isoprenylcysteine O-methyltransferase Ste14